MCLAMITATIEETYTMVTDTSSFETYHQTTAPYAGDSFYNGNDKKDEEKKSSIKDLKGISTTHSIQTIMTTSVNDMNTKVKAYSKDVAQTHYGNATTTTLGNEMEITATLQSTLAQTESQNTSEIPTPEENCCADVEHTGTDILTPSNETDLGCNMTITINQQNCDHFPDMPPVYDSSSDFKYLFMDLTVEDCELYSCSDTLCKCDPACLLYGDCCYDYIEKLLSGDLQEKNVIDKLRNKTVLLGSLVQDDVFATELFIQHHSKCILHEDRRRSLWMISKCPENFTDAETKQKCEDELYYGLDSIPGEWRDANGRIWIFRNSFCALCHGFNPELIEPWEVDFVCGQGGEKDILPPGLVNMTDLRLFCSADFKSKSSMSTRFQRNCLITDMQKQMCENNLATRSLSVMCESYIYFVEDSGVQYQNPHCAVCETGKSNYSTLCEKTFTDESFKRPVNLQVLFDFNKNAGFTVQVYCKPHKECFYFEIYDCITRQCRRLYCSDKQLPHFGKCIMASNSSFQGDIWYEESLPRDIGNSIENGLYLEIDVISPFFLSINEIKSFLLTELRSVENVISSHLTKTSYLNFDEKDREKNQKVNDTSPRNEDTAKYFKTSETETTTDIGVTAELNVADSYNSTGNLDHWLTTPDVVESITNVYAGGPTHVVTQSIVVSSSNTYEQDNISENNPRAKETVVSKKGEKEGTMPPGIDTGKHDTKVDESEKVQFYYSYTATIVSKVHSLVLVKELIHGYNSLMENSAKNGFIVSDMNITARTYTDIQSLSCDVGNLTIRFNEPYFKDMSEVGMIKNMNKVSVDKVQWKVSHKSSENSMFDAIAICLTQYHVPDMQCNMTAYKGNEVFFKENGIQIKGTSAFYKHSEYVKVGSKIFMCIENLTGKTYVSFFKYSKLQRILSIVTCSASLICLSFICLAHIIFSKLRNNHGLNLLALSATMLLVQGLILAGGFPGNAACLCFAAVLHFLVLKMFIWMNIIGLDMALTFNINTVTLTRKNASRFFKYCIVAFSLPFLFVATGLLLEFSQANLRPGYGDGGICWMTNSAWIIMFFIVPISVSMTLNLVLFLISLYSIQNARAKSSVRRNSRHRTYCFVYFKMSVILGFTWAVGIIAAFVSVGWLWYVHIVLNGLQGLSLFLCSMVNARTVKLFKGREKIKSISETKLSQISKDT